MISPSLGLVSDAHGTNTKIELNYRVYNKQQDTGLSSDVGTPISIVPPLPYVHTVQ